MIIMPVMARCYRAPKSDWEAPYALPTKISRYKKKKVHSVGTMSARGI